MAIELPPLAGMTSLPLVLDDEPIGIIMRLGASVVRPTKIWAYCWCADEGAPEDHTHRHLPVDPRWPAS